MMKILLLISSFLSSVSAQLVCPGDWVPNEDRCYHFVFDSLNYVDAAKECKGHGAILLTVETVAEHSFVVNRLRNIDPIRNEWYTSGERDISAMYHRYVWTATNVELGRTSPLWINPDEPFNNDLTRNVLVYRYDYDRGVFGLAVVGGRSMARPYICEISRSEVYRINIEDRDFGYGIPFTEIDQIERGPKYMLEPQDTIILGETTFVYLECLARGVPQPDYRWIHTETGDVITSETDSRYTLTNGRLSIQFPDNTLDEGRYHCQAFNSKGTIIGAPAQIFFAELGEFPNINAAPVSPRQYEGAVIECPAISSTMAQALRYQWLRYSNDTQDWEFVRPDLNPHTFISGNGKLYFSEVTTNDDGNYSCVATLTNVVEGHNYAWASQTPSRTSRMISLSVQNGGGGTYDPRIQDSFINVVPGSPLVGMNISLECFAYGTTPLVYSWEFPHWDNFRYRYTDSKRVLHIDSVHLDDSGVYTCTVAHALSTSNFDRKSYIFQVEGKPDFILPLADKHLDVGTQQLTWRCEARALPFPHYTWYKDGTLLTSTGDITVFENTLVLRNLDKDRDEGMYQCAANNTHGVIYTTAELRILSLAPTFEKAPMSLTVGGALGGTVIIDCSPEAAPFPEFTWLFNSGTLNPSLDGSGRISMFSNGNLQIRDLSYSDQGQYECRATNILGTDTNKTALTIFMATTIFQPPSPDTVQVNRTAFLYCQASYNQNNLDLAYQWAFNGRIINIDNDPHFSRGTPPDNEGGLYVTSAQFDHAGLYTCIARTQVDSANSSAYLTVEGPPAAIAGVQAYAANIFMVDSPIDVGPRDVVLRWTNPTDVHGDPISSYIVYGQTNYTAEWKLLQAFVQESETIIANINDPQRRQYLLKSLKPGVSYMFKMTGVNTFGVGDESIPTKWVVIPGAAPIMFPSNIGGGGGKVGTLRIAWTPLPPEDHNGWGIGYEVEWRRKPPPGEENSNIKWDKAIVNGNQGHYSHTIGTDNYYLPYNVKVTPFNMYGPGLTGFNDTVYSAMDMPLGVPSGVYAESFNESAMIVYWQPVADSRETMKGRLKGYKIRYWLMDIDSQEDAVESIVYGDVDHGMVIGLIPDTWYTSHVIVFNDAGNGLRSEVCYQSTDRPAPREYPINVMVYPHGSNAVRVRYRGLSTSNMEEPLLGYRIRYWRDTDDIRTAKDVECEKNMEGTVEAVQNDQLYHLRVFGYSRGGDGKMSSPETLFSLSRGRVTQIQWDPATSEVQFVLHDGTAGLMASWSLTMVLGILSALGHV